MARRVFLDANVLFSAAWRENSSLLRLWAIKSFHLITHAYAVEEARRNLNHPDLIQRLDRLLLHVEVADVDIELTALNIHLPQKDIPIMCAAIEMRANILVTGDFRHFGKYYGKVIDGVRIEPPAELLKTRVD